MLNQCIIQGIVKLGVCNLKKLIFETFCSENLSVFFSLGTPNAYYYLLLLNCRIMSDYVQDWSLEPGLPNLDPDLD